MFKAGDKVEVKGYTEEWDGEGDVEECSGRYVIIKFNRKFPRNRGAFPPQYVHKIGNPSPVRTVTRREIVPGVYGRIEICEAADKIQTWLRVVDRGRVPHGSYTVFSAEELREAAHIFNQLAEVLEENQ